MAQNKDSISFQVFQSMKSISSVNLQLWLHPEQTHHFLWHLFSQLKKRPIRKAQVLIEVLELKAATELV